MPGVLFDGRWMRPGMTGVGICAYNLVAAMARTERRYGVIANPDSALPPIGPNGTVHITKVKLTSHPLTELFEQIAIPTICKRHGYNAFLSFEGRVPLFHPGISTLSYIHDLTIFKIPGSHSLKYSFFLKISLAISRLSATRIITVSDTVKQDMKSILGINPESVLVLPNSDSGFSGGPEQALPFLDGRFLLSVGMTNPRKNLGVLLKAFKVYQKENPNHKLAVTGNRKWLDDEIKNHGCSNVVNLGYVSQSEMLFLFRNADALVYPSKDEGFGIPLVDAWVNKCPVYCSDIPVFREVMGGYAEYFDCNSEASLVNMLKAHKGRESWMGRKDPPISYSWDLTAKTLLKFLADLQVKA